MSFEMPMPSTSSASPPERLEQASVGIGWRHPHYASVLEQPPGSIDFLEVHAENFFGEGGARLAVLLQTRQHFPVSLHGVGLSLGSAAGLDAWHLDQLASLVARTQPALVSDHASFARVASRGHVLHAADLLPVPLSKPALDVMVSNVQQVQDRLKRRIAVENLSAYVQWPGMEMTETTFLNELARRSGCQLLVDLNNVMVNVLNDDLDASPGDVQARCELWLESLNGEHIAEFHLAGHQHCGDIVFDDHGSAVSGPVWALYRYALERHGPRPTLIEWDTDVPALEVLLEEARIARWHQQSVTSRSPAGEESAKGGVCGALA